MKCLWHPTEHAYLNLFLGKSWSNLGAICSRKYVPEANRTPISDGNFGNCCLDRRVCFNSKFKESYVLESEKSIIHLNNTVPLFRFLVSFLPETTNHKLPDTIAEGELLGKGDTFYTSICRSKNIRRKEKYEVNGVV